MDKLEELSKRYGCTFCLPPFENTNFPFFVTNTITDDEKRVQFFNELDTMGIIYEYKKSGKHHCFILQNTEK